MQSYKDFITRAIFLYWVTSVQEIGKNIIFLFFHICAKFSWKK